MNGSNGTFRIMRFVRHVEESNLKAFCDVALENHLLIKGVRIVQGRHGPFVSMPRLKSTKGDWHDAVVPLSKEIREELHRVVLEAYYRHCRENK